MCHEIKSLKDSIIGKSTTSPIYMSTVQILQVVGKEQCFSRKSI
jgi:hypothetical protein